MRDLFLNIVRNALSYRHINMGCKARKNWGELCRKLYNEFMEYGIGEDIEIYRQLADVVRKNNF